MTLRALAAALVAATTVVWGPVSGTAPRAAEAAPEASAEADVAFTYAVRAFNQGRYQEALEEFGRLAARDRDDGTALHWLGLTKMRLGDAAGAASDIAASLKARRPPAPGRARVLADLASARLEAGDPAGALQACDEALAGAPGDATARYLRGLAQARLGRAEEGRAEAARARSGDASLPEVPSAVMEPGRGEIVEAAELPFWEIRIGASAGGDSNPSTLPDMEEEVLDPNAQEHFDGSDLVGTGDLRLEIHPFYDAAGWSLGLRLDGYQSLHGDLDRFDLTREAGVVQLAWGKDPLGFATGPMGYTRVPAGRTPATFLLQAGSSYVQLDGESHLRTHEAAAAVMLPEGSRTATQIELHYEDLGYSDNPGFSFDARSLSGHRTSLRASQYLYGARRDRYLRLGATAGEARAREAALDASSLGGFVEASLPLHRRVFLFGSAGWTRDTYDDVRQLLAGSRERRDGTLEAAAAVAFGLGRHLYATVRLSHTDRGVSLDPDGEASMVMDEVEEEDLEFERTVATAGLTWYY